VIVPRTGGTGSVGVITAHVDLSKALDNAGIKVTLIASGERKADGNEYEPLSKQAYARIPADVDAVGELFVATVARNRARRGLTVAKVWRTQGATFLSAKGVGIGFADAVMPPDRPFASLLQTLSDRRLARDSGVRQMAHTASRRTAKRSWSRLAFNSELARAR
jgi:ClpP class serine protease